MNWRSLGILSFSLYFACWSQAAPELNRELPTFSQAQLKTAEAALADTFTFQGATGSPLIEHSSKYDWQHGGPKNDKEWAWFLNRHRYFEDLYLAHSATGDTRYVDKLFAILADWLEEYENAPRGMSFSAAWRPLEAARRILESWDIIYVQLWEDPNFPAELKPKFLHSLENHGDYLQSHHALYGNHLITEMLALLKLSLLIPEAGNSATWQQYALQQLEAEYRRQFYPSGAHKELSSHYQRVVLLNFQLLLTLLESAEKDRLLETWRPRVDAMWSYFNAIQKPSGWAPLNNDSDQENIRQLLRQHGRDQLPAPQTSHYFADAGQVIFRSPATDAPLLWAFFDIGPRGSDHQHEDFLHLSLSLGENDLLVDSGRYSYQPGAWREYFQGARGHNVLLIDGQESVPKPKAAQGPLAGAGYIRTQGYEAGWGTTRFQDGTGAEIAQWQRCVAVIPEVGLLVLDQLISFEPRQLQGYWHAAPGAAWQIGDPTALQLINGRAAANVTQVSSSAEPLQLSVETGKTTPGIQGWHSPRFNRKSATQTLSYTVKVSQPTVFAWLFSPSGHNCQLISLEPTHSKYQLHYHQNGAKQRLTIELPNQNRPFRLLP